LLHHLGYGLQANAKVTEAAQHPDRDGQSRSVDDTAAEHLGSGQPVISVDGNRKGALLTHQESGLRVVLRGDAIGRAPCRCSG
jgi:hypothetical protein